MADLKVPPHNEDAEVSVLGAILLDKDAIIEVAEFLRPEHFYNPVHEKIYRSILSLYEKREPIDLVTLTAELKKRKHFTEIGGASYLTELTISVPMIAHAEQYGRIIEDAYTKRELIAAASKVIEDSFFDTGEVKDLLDRAESSIFTLSQRHSRQNFIPIKEALAESFDRLDELHKTAGGLRGVATGFLDLDNKLAGMQASNLLILAARPGLGKTAMVLNIAQYVSVHDKVPVGIFSLEMSKEELVDRLLVSQADVDAWRLKTGRLNDEDFTRLSEAMGELAEAPLFIDDTPGLNILEMRTKARKLQVEHDLKLLIVDYLQLVDPGRRLDNRVVEVSMISQSLKNLARELKIPILAVSQLSRAVETRGGGRPQLADLRESGAIEQDADVVMFLYRKEEEEGTLADQIPTQLSISKHRNGPTGEINLIFKGNRIKFYGVEKKREG